MVLTGTHKIEVGTASGLLSLTALTGKPANISFYVKNTGSAAQNNVKLLSFKPENWKVEFEKASKNLEFRVTVKASTVWGWAGIAIIVLVVLGLVVLFVRMGRR